MCRRRPPRPHCPRGNNGVKRLIPWFVMEISMNVPHRYCMLIALCIAGFVWSPGAVCQAGQTDPAQKVDEAEIAKYVRDLKSPDEKVRYDAVYALGDAGTAAA